MCWLCWLLVLALLIIAPLAVVWACKLGYARGHAQGLNDGADLLIPHLRGPE